MPALHRLFLGLVALCLVLLLVVCNVGLTQTKPKEAPPELKDIGNGLHAYYEQHETFPMAGSLIDGGFRYPAWQVELLPFIGELVLYQQIDRDVSWNAAANRPVFEQQVPLYQGKFEKKVKKDLDGFAVTQYSANNRIMHRRSGLSFRDITDGTSNTLMIGEIGTDYPAWARPGNVRDPVNGLGGKSEQFGRPDGTGALFLMCDGQVRRLSAKTDPVVLKALSTPARGEEVDSPVEGENSADDQTRNDKKANSKSPKPKKKTPAKVPAKELATPPSKLSEADEFQLAYECERTAQFRIVSPPAFRNERIKPLWDTWQKNRGFPTKWLDISERIAVPSTPKINWQNDAQGKADGASPKYCRFLQCIQGFDAHNHNAPPVRFTLDKIASAWTLNDLLEPIFENWQPDQLYINTPDGREPDFGFHGDLVIRFCNGRKLGGGGIDSSTSLATFDPLGYRVPRLLTELEDYCANGPSHLQDVRFRISKREIVSIDGPLIPPDFRVKPPADSPMLDGPKRDKAFEELCQKLGTAPSRSQFVLDNHLLAFVPPQNLPNDTTTEAMQAEPERRRQACEENRKVFVEKLRQARIPNVHFPTKKIPVVECYRLDKVPSSK